MFATIRNFFHRLFTKEQPAMTDTVDTTAPVAPVAPVVTPVASVVSTDLAKLKALLVAAGHKIEADWDLLVQVASK